MVTVKFMTDKLDAGMFFILPTIIVDKTFGEKVICFAWLKGLLGVSIK